MPDWSTTRPQADVPKSTRARDDTLSPASLYLNARLHYHSVSIGERNRRTWYRRIDDEQCLRRRIRVKKERTSTRGNITRLFVSFFHKSKNDHLRNCFLGSWFFLKSRIFMFKLNCLAVLSCSAVLRRPAARLKQASCTRLFPKISLIF